MKKDPYSYFGDLIIEESEIVDTFIVRLKIGHDETNCLLLLENAPCEFIWDVDWWEGEDTVELIGYIPMLDVQPEFAWLNVEEEKRIWRKG